MDDVNIVTFGDNTNPAYILSLDAIDLNFLSIPRYQRSDETVPLWTCQSSGPDGEYAEFAVFADEADSDHERQENETSSQCHVCSVRVPRAYWRQHADSAAHRACAQIADLALSRAREQISVLPETCEPHGDTYYCPACSCAVSISKRSAHETSEQHSECLLYNKLIRTLASLYENRNNITKVCEEIFGENGLSTLMKYEEISKEVTNEAKIQTKPEIDVNDNTADKKFDSGAMPEYVIINTKSGAKVRVSFDNYHGFCKAGDKTLCKVCRVLIDDKLGHLDSEHKKKVEKVITDEHCIRQLDNILNHCIICNELIENIEVHILCCEEHKALLADALIEDVTSKPHENHVTKEMLKENHMQIVGYNGNNCYCKVCHTYIENTTVKEHINKQHHKDNLNSRSVNDKEIQNTEFHNESKLHQNNSLKTQISSVTQQPSTKLLNEIVKADAETTKYICKICNVEVPNKPSNIKEHNDGNRHKVNKHIAEGDQTKLMQARSIDNISTNAKQITVDFGGIKIDDEFIPYLQKKMCFLCKEKYTGRKTHLKEKCHNDNVQLLKLNTQSITTPPNNKLKNVIENGFCNVCNTKVPNTGSNIIEHLMGQSHSDRVRCWQNKSNMHQNLTAKLPNTNNNVTEHLLGQVHSDVEVYNKFRSILEKLTPQNFDRMVEKVKLLEINNQKRLEGVVDIVFEKAIDEPDSCGVYAAMCDRLAKLKVPADNPATPDQCVNFRALIITKCQNQFVTDKVDESVFKLEKEIIECTDPAKKKELQLKLEQEKNRILMRSLGNVRFIGELYKLKMLTVKIMVYCMNQLIDDLDDDKLKRLCVLLTTIGEQVESEVKEPLDNVFKKLQDIVDHKPEQISSRVRRIIRAVIELRRKGWVSKSVVDSHPKGHQKRHIEFKHATPACSQSGNSSNMDISNWRTSRPNNTVQTESLRCKVASSLFPPFITAAPVRDGPFPAAPFPAAAPGRVAPTPAAVPAVFPFLAAAPSPVTPSPAAALAPVAPFPATVPARIVPFPAAPSPAAASAPVAQEWLRLPDYKRKSVKYMIELCLINPDDDEMIAEIKCRFPPQYHADVVTEILNIVLEKSAEDVASVSKSMLHLITTNTISPDNFLAGLRKVLEFAPDLQIDIPKLYEYLGLLMAPQIEKEHITFTQIKRLCETIISANHGHLLLKAIINNMGSSFAKIKWHESGLQFKDWMNEDRVPKWIEDNKFEFLESKKIIFPAEIRSKLLPVINTDENCDYVKGLTQDNVEASYEEAHIEKKTHKMLTDKNEKLVSDFVLTDGKHYFCEICEVSVEREDADDHIESETHKINLNKNKTLLPTKKHYLFAPSDEHCVKCLICKVNVPYEEVSSHRKNETHKQQYKNWLYAHTMVKVRDETCFCECCRVILKLSEVYIHATSLTHRINNLVLNKRMDGETLQALTTKMLDENVVVNYEDSDDSADEMFENLREFLSLHSFNYEQKGSDDEETSLSDSDASFVSAKTNAANNSTLEPNTEQEEEEEIVAKKEELELAEATKRITHLFEKTDISKQLLCKLCDCDVPNRSDLIIEHVEGVKHIRKYEVILKSNQIKEINNHSTEIIEKYRCGACAEDVEKSQLFVHLNDGRHKMYLAVQPSTSGCHQQPKDSETENRETGQDVNEVRSHKTYLMEYNIGVSNKWLCKLCCTAFTDFTDATVNGHVGSVTHQIKFRSLLQEHEVRKVGANMCCDLCKIGLIEGSELAHIYGNGHIENRKKYTLSFNKSDNTIKAIVSHKCTTCNIETPNNPYYIKLHNESQQHQNNLIKTKNSSMKQQPSTKLPNANVCAANIEKTKYICDICDVEVPNNPYGIKMHNDGKKHKLNEDIVKNKNVLVQEQAKVMQASSLSGPLINATQIIDVNSARIIIDDKTKFYVQNGKCNLCKVEVTGNFDNISGHLKGQKHNNNVQLLKLNTTPPNNKLKNVIEDGICNICNMMLANSSNNFIEHLMGQAHSDRVKYLQKKSYTQHLSGVAGSSKNVTGSTQPITAGKASSPREIATTSSLEVLNAPFYVCKICNMVVPNRPQNRSDHYNDANHMKHFNKLSQVDQVRFYKTEFKYMMSSSNNQKNADGSQNHQSTKENKANETNSSDGTASVDSYCNICKVKVPNNPNNINEHVKGSLHKKNVSKHHQSGTSSNIAPPNNSQATNSEATVKKKRTRTRKKKTSTQSIV